jgi:hypothetical protein
MSELLKQVIELAKQLNYEENEALRSVLHDINWKRKQALEKQLNESLA